MTNNVEILVKDKKDFDIISSHSDYSSKLTGVCVLTNDEANLLSGLHSKMMDKYIHPEAIGETIKPTISISSQGIIKIKDADIATLAYLGIYSSYDPVIKVGSYSKMFNLLEKEIIVPDRSLENRLGYWDLDSPLSGLICYTPKFRFKKVLWSLKTQKTGDTGRSIGLQNLKVVKKRLIYLDGLMIVDGPTSTETHGKSFSLVNGAGKKYTMVVFALSPLLQQVLVPGKVVSVLSERVYGTDENESGYTIISPIFVPKNFKMKYRNKIGAPRTIPIAIWDAAYSEWQYRKNRKEEVK